MSAFCLWVSPRSVLMVDELDSLMDRKQSFFYNLFDWPTLPESRLVVIGIANSMNLPEQLHSKIQSRLGLQRVAFLPYNEKQIMKILMHRLLAEPDSHREDNRHGIGGRCSSKPSPEAGAIRDSQSEADLHRLEQVFDPDAVELCARKVASTSGDLRRALQICRRSIQVCCRELLKAVCQNSSIFPPPPRQPSLASWAAKPGRSISGGAAVDPGAAQVTMSHVDTALHELYDNGYVEWLAGASVVEQIILASIIKIMVQTGAELVDLQEVATRVQNASHLRGVDPAPSVRLVLGISQRLEQLGIVSLDWSRGNAVTWPLVCLLVQLDDVKYALRDSPHFKI